MKLTGLEKIRAGLYKHVASGRLIVRTDGWEGPRGGRWDRWEHGFWDEWGKLCVDGYETFATLKAATAALDASALKDAGVPDGA